MLEMLLSYLINILSNQKDHQQYKDYRITSYESQNCCCDCLPSQRHNLQAQAAKSIHKTMLLPMLQWCIGYDNKPTEGKEIKDIRDALPLVPFHKQVALQQIFHLEHHHSHIISHHEPITWNGQVRSNIIEINDKENFLTYGKWKEEKIFNKLLL